MRKRSRGRGAESCVNPRVVLLFLGLVLLRAVVKQLLVHLHEELQGVVDQAVDRPEKEEEEDQCGNSVSCSENKQEPRLCFIYVLFICKVCDGGGTVTASSSR